MRQRIVGVFESSKAAEQARTALVKVGIPGERIAVSRDPTEDAIAAEAPGQTYHNQPGQAANDTAWARYGELLRVGNTVISVEVPTRRETMLIEDLLRRNGAVRTAKQEEWR